jgi:hypothetical protein
MLLPCELLDENERNERRSIKDALEVLRSKANFEQDDVAEVRLGILRLPSDKIVSLVIVSFDSTIHQKTFLVSLPTADSFRAKLENLPVSQEFEIARLAGATIDSGGQVRLSDGAQIRGVEVIPALLPYNITPLDWAIIRQTIATIGIEDRCRYHPGDLVLEKLGFNPFRNSIDCSKLSDHPAGLLKVIQARIQDHESSFGTVSLQKIADTLRKFGMRIPVARPRLG